MIHKKNQLLKLMSVALCDVDRNTLDTRGAKYPEAKRYRDYRKMLEEMDTRSSASGLAPASKPPV